MTVIKKDGRKQPFVPHKISTSAIGTARDVGVNLSDREGEILSQDVTKYLLDLRGEDGVTSSYEIRIILALAMKRFGYPTAAAEYLLDALE